MKEDTDYPILVVDCKAPEVYPDEKAHEQVLDYSDALGADYAMVCNGTDLFCYRYLEEKYSDGNCKGSIPFARCETT